MGGKYISIVKDMLQNFKGKHLIFVKWIQGCEIISSVVFRFYDVVIDILYVLTPL